MGEFQSFTGIGGIGNPLQTIVPSGLSEPGPASRGQVQMIKDQPQEDFDIDQPLAAISSGGPGMVGAQLADSFHGPGGSTLARYLPDKHLCEDHTFFRILEGSMSKYTLQGSVKDQRHDFIIQCYSALCDEPQLQKDGGKTILVCPAGMPLVWDTNNILYETLVSDLLIWQISGAQYHPLKVPHLSHTQLVSSKIHSQRVLVIFNKACRMQKLETNTMKKSYQISLGQMMRSNCYPAWFRVVQQWGHPTRDHTFVIQTQEGCTS